MNKSNPPLRDSGGQDHVSGSRHGLRWLFASLLLLAVFAAPPATAQYFGQNKVNYEYYDWYYIKTEHFDIYHPKESFAIAQFAGWIAEESLTKIEKSWNYKLQGRITIIVYPSHNAFQNNNVGSGSPDESTGGFTEFLKDRVVIPFQGSYEMFRHVIHHELTHAVMMRMLYGEGVQSIITGISRLPIPLWYTEGLAEYESNNGWTNEADLYIRDAIINDYLMPIDRLQGYFIYKGGQSVLYYLQERYGKKKVGELMRAIRNKRDFNRAVKSTLGYDVEELSKRWQKHLKKQIWPTAGQFEAPEDFSLKLTKHDDWYNFINTSPALSPDGGRLVMLSDKDDYMSIYLINTVTGKIEERLVKGGGQGIYLFEQLLWLRPWITWSPDGHQIAFVAEAGPEDALYTLNVETGEITHEFRFGLDGVFSPTWSPDGKSIAFSGHQNGESDIYVVDVDDPGSFRHLTTDKFSDYDPNWGPNGKVLFVSDRGDSLNPVNKNIEMWKEDFRQIDIYSIDVNTHKIARLTDDVFEERSPTWTPHADTLSYISDRTGAYNMYLMDSRTKETWAISDVLTGVFTPSWSKSGTVAFTSFYDAGYDIYLYKNPFDPERRKTPELTYFQQKVRGLIKEEGGPAGEPSLALADEDSMKNAPFPFTTGHVLSGSAEEDSIRAALGEASPSGADSTQAAPDTVAAKKEAGEKQEQASTPKVERPVRIVSSLPPEPAETDSTKSDSTKKGEGVRIVSGKAGEDSTGSAPYQHFIFYAPGMSGPNQVEHEIEKKDETPPDSLLDENGLFRQHKYKLKFSPDIVYASAGYSTFFGLQGYGQMMFSDILGDHIIFVGTDLYYNFENSNFDLFYYYLPHRTDYGGGIFHNVYFFNYGAIRDRNYGASLNVSYPFSRFNRVDFSGAFINISRDLWDYNRYDYAHYEDRHFLLPSLDYVYDNTLWGWTGPINGMRYRVGFAYSPKMSKNTNQKNLWGIDFKTVSFDVRRYYHVGFDYSFALRAAGAVSWGENPQQFFLGGVDNWINRRFNGGIRVNIDDIYFSGFATPLRGADYYEKQGDRYLLTNAEFRFPLVRQLLFGWPLPFFFYNVRGALFVDAGSAWTGNNFRGTRKDASGSTEFNDIVLGYGWGARINLGVFLLKFDVAWRNNLNYVSKPKYYISLGTDL